MQNSTLFIIIAVVILIAAMCAWFIIQRRRSQSLKHRFGPEYDRAVREQGGMRKAEAVLGEREKRVEKFHIVELNPSARERFAAAWKAAQAHFVDNPKAAVQEADRLVGDVMRERGYPMVDFEQRAADVSVDHPRLVDDYRSAHAIALRDQKDGVTTEQLRTAMVHYRALFEDLLGVTVVRHAEAIR